MAAATCHLGNRVMTGTPVNTRHEKGRSLLEKQEFEMNTTETTMTHLNNHELTIGELDAVLGGEKADAWVGVKAGVSGSIGTSGGDKGPRGGMVIVVGLLLLFGM